MGHLLLVKASFLYFFLALLVTIMMQYCTDKERHEASLWRPRVKRTQRIPYCSEHENSLIQRWEGRTNRGKPHGGRINYMKDRDTYLGRLPPHQLQPTPPKRPRGKACPPIPASEVDCCLRTSELQPNHKLITWYDQEKKRIDGLGLMSGLQSLRNFNVSKKQHNVLQDERNYYCEMLQRAGDEVHGIPDGTLWVHSNEIGEDKDKNRDKKREIYKNPTFLGKKKKLNRCGAI